MSDKLRVGIVGCGLVAEGQHIPGFMRLKGKAFVQAVCDRNEKLAVETAKRCGIPGAYGDLSQMLGKEKLNIISICTPPQTHTALALQAIERGCHVLLEKPMALKAIDCDQMIEAALKRSVKLCIIHNVLFAPVFIKARKLVAEGAIGDFIGMRILLSDPREDMILKKDHWIHKLPGGLIGESGPHVVYMSLAFLDKVRDVDVHARSVLEHAWAPFDELRIELEGEKTVSSIAVSYASNRRNLYVDILGTEGALYLDIASMLLVRQGAKESMGPLAFARYISGMGGQVGRGILGNGFNLAFGRLRNGHATLIEGFVNSILSNQPSPVTGEEGRETTRVMEMIVDRLHRKYPAAYGSQPEKK